MESARKGHKFVVVDCPTGRSSLWRTSSAEFRRKQRKIYAYMKTKSEIKLAFSILEKGVDGMVVPVLVARGLAGAIAR